MPLMQVSIQIKIVDHLPEATEHRVGAALALNCLTSQNEQQGYELYWEPVGLT